MQNVELGHPRSHCVHLGDQMCQIDVASISLLYWSEDASAALGQRKRLTWSGIVISHLGHFKPQQNVSGLSEGNQCLFFCAVTIRKKKQLQQLLFVMQLFFKGGRKQMRALGKAYIMLQKCTRDTHTHNSFFFFPNQRTMYYLCFHLGLVWTSAFGGVIRESAVSSRFN